MQQVIYGLSLLLVTDLWKGKVMSGGESQG